MISYRENDTGRTHRTGRWNFLFRSGSGTKDVHNAQPNKETFLILMRRVSLLGCELFPHSAEESVFIMLRRYSSLGGDRGISRCCNSVNCTSERDNKQVGLWSNAVITHYFSILCKYRRYERNDYFTKR